MFSDTVHLHEAEAYSIHCSSNAQSRYNGRPSRQMKAALPFFNNNNK